MPSQKVRHDWATFTFHCHLSVPKWNPTLCDSVECSTPGSSVLHYLPAFAQIHVHWDSDANNLTLCHPLLLLPSVFPSIRVFSNKSSLHGEYLLLFSHSVVSFCDPMDCSTPGLSVPHRLLKLAQVHVHCLGDAIQPSHPLMPSSSSALNLSQHQGLSLMFASADKNTGVSTSASVLPTSIQSWFSFKTDWFDLLAVQGALRSLLQHHSSEASDYILYTMVFLVVTYHCEGMENIVNSYVISLYGDIS